MYIKTFLAFMFFTSCLSSPFPHRRRDNGQGTQGDRGNGCPEKDSQGDADGHGEVADYNGAPQNYSQPTNVTDQNGANPPATVDSQYQQKAAVVNSSQGSSENSSSNVTSTDPQVVSAPAGANPGVRYQQRNVQVTADNGGSTASSNNATSSSGILVSGSGHTTYYYDMPGNMCNANEGGILKGPNKCGGILGDMNTNKIVAIGQLNGGTADDMSKYCGKRVVIHYNGKTYDDGYYVWDGCQACRDNNFSIIDLSSSASNDIDSNACTNGGLRGDVSWDIMNDNVVPYSG